MRPPSRQPHNILIIHTHGGMGDLLLSSVLAEALHRCYPGCCVTFWAQRKFAALLDHHPFVDARIDLDHDQFAARARAEEMVGKDIAAAAQQQQAHGRVVFAQLPVIVAVLLTPIPVVKVCKPVQTGV